MWPRMRFAAVAVSAIAFAGPWVTGSAVSDIPKRTPLAGTAPYHRDPDHLWNRVYAALNLRTGPDGKEYGPDRLEPLLWAESEHLLEGKSAEHAAAVLDEFLQKKGETLTEDPLKRALLQRDLWLVANWAAQSGNNGSMKLLKRLAPAIRRLALSPEQIAELPDNYAQAVASRRFPQRFDPDQPNRGHLPPDLLRGDGPWVCVGRGDGPTAPRHLVSGTNPFTNSTFLVVLKLPAGRAATLDFLKRLAAFDRPLYLPNTDAKTKPAYPNLPNPALPQWPKGTEVALVRRALLIDTAGRVVPSPVTESVQLRVQRIDVPALAAGVLSELERGLTFEVTNGYGIDVVPPKSRFAWDAQSFAEIRLSRAALFAEDAGGLRDVSGELDFKTGFDARGSDKLTDRGPGSFGERLKGIRKVVGHSCIGCHRYPGVYSFNSFHEEFADLVRVKLSRDEDDGGRVPGSHALSATTVEKVEQAAVRWKQEQPGWKALKKLLPE